MAAPAPPDLVALAAHPLRWRLLTELGRSDRRVNELTRAVGEPQNLVSYHLGLLRRAELVTARRSRADGRDTYYLLDLDRVQRALIATGTGVHPGVRLTPAANTPPAAAPRPRVLFLCTGNSARSQIAEALAHHRSGGWVDATSAGSHPKTLHPDAVRVLAEEYGIDRRRADVTHVDAVRHERYQRIVTLCDRVREVCPEFPGHPEASHWSIPDPAADTADDADRYRAFVATAAEIDARVGFFVAALAAAATTPVTPVTTKEHP